MTQTCRSIFSGRSRWQAALLALAVIGLTSHVALATELRELVSPDAKATKVVGDCAFTEGPA